jgi:hypothetical protein
LTYQNEVSDIISITKKAVSASLGESLANVTIELKELSKLGQVLTIIGTFKIAPFFITRTGKVYVTLLQSAKGLEITNLKIDEEKGL